VSRSSDPDCGLSAGPSAWQGFLAHFAEDHACAFTP
jgi:hypothetical protein